MLNFKRSPCSAALVLFSDASLRLHAGWRIGVAGRNGAGKSSLFALVAGELAVDAGEFTRPRDWILSLRALWKLPSADAHRPDYVPDGDAEYRRVEPSSREEAAHDAAAIAEAHDRLAAMGAIDPPPRAAGATARSGIRAGRATRAVGEFSGGWRVRLNLGGALMCYSDCCWATNHLDLDAVVWLEGWLRRY